MLGRHESALAGLRSALVDLEASPSYLMLTGDELGAETRAEVGSAVDGATSLWPLIEAADGALTHVRRYVDANGAKGEHRREVARLLTERWVTVEGFDAPLAIVEVLGRFRADYDSIRERVTEINDLWLAILPRIDAARSTLARLEAEIADLGVPEPLIGRARALAEDLERRLVSDPLSVVEADGPQLDAQVAAAADQVAALRSGHDNLEDDLRSTEPLLASLRVLRARAQAAAGESRAKVHEPEGLIQVPTAAVIDGEAGLAARLDEVFALSGGGSWNRCRALLDSWLETARKLERQLVRAEAANREPLARRDELRGRLRAYQAKIAAMGKAEDLDLTAIADEARAELFTAPTDLGAAAARIEDLARRLRS